MGFNHRPSFAEGSHDHDSFIKNTETQTKGLARYLPILAWLPKYQRAWLRTDLIAGLTVVALLIPEGMAYAQIAGMPPEAAFYAAPIGLLAFAIFGTSRQLVVAVSAIIATIRLPRSARSRRRGRPNSSC